MSWTDDRVAMLKKMWKDGHSAADIAKALGKGVTRNAVIGKAHRMGLSGRPSPIKGGEEEKPTKAKKADVKKAEKKVKEKKEPKAKKADDEVKVRKATTNSSVAKKAAAKNNRNEFEKDEIVLANLDAETPPEDGGVALIDLTEHMCRWPYGDPREEGFTFCGRPVYPGKPYCADHVLVAYQGLPKTRNVAKVKDVAVEDVVIDVDIEDIDGEVDEDEVGNVE